MKKFKTKTEFIEAVQFDGSNYQEIKYFIEMDDDEPNYLKFMADNMPYIRTTKCDIYFNNGDWIVKNSLGEVHVAYDERFKLEYDPIETITMPDGVEAYSNKFNVILVKMNDKEYTTDIVGASRLLRDLRIALEFAVGYNNLPE